MTHLYGSMKMKVPVFLARASVVMPPLALYLILLGLGSACSSLELLPSSAAQKRTDRQRRLTKEKKAQFPLAPIPETSKNLFFPLI